MGVINPEWLTERPRFWAKVRPAESSDCLLWVAASDAKGYGRFWDNGRLITAHRWSFEQYVGPVPAGMQVLHRCDVKPCVWPDHLYAGTHRDNVDDAIERGRYANTRKTHCPRGHRYAGGNLRIRADGRRRCLSCSRSEVSA